MKNKEQKMYDELEKQMNIKRQIANQMHESLLKETLREFDQDRELTLYTVNIFVALIIGIALSLLSIMQVLLLVMLF